MLLFSLFLIHPSVHADVSPFSRAAWPEERNLDEVTDDAGWTDDWLLLGGSAWPPRESNREDFALAQFHWALMADPDDQQSITTMDFSFSFSFSFAFAFPEPEDSLSFYFDHASPTTPPRVPPMSSAPLAPARAPPTPSAEVTATPTAPLARTRDGGGGVWVPRVGDKWQYNLTPPVDTDVDADIFFIDTAGASGEGGLVVATTAS